MKPEDVVCTFEQSKKLITLGLRLSTIWCYELISESKGELTFSMDNCPFEELKECFIPAYTVAELGILLPYSITVKNEPVLLWERKTYSKEFIIRLEFSASEVFHSIKGKTEAQARAEALIWLLENKYIDPDSLAL